MDLSLEDNILLGRYRYIIDFIYIERELIVEVDGGQHNYKEFNILKNVHAF